MSDESPTVVLVHGAFADSSSWTGVIERLQTAGVAVTRAAGANPLRGITQRRRLHRQRHRRRSLDRSSPSATRTAAP